MNSRQRAREWPFRRHKQFSRELRQTAAQWFREKQYATHPRMPYCLAKWEDWPSNIILREVSDYIAARSAEAQKKEIPFPLHKYLHHGMSSQAMAFNLIGPMITRNHYEALGAVLKAKGVSGADDIAEAAFEYEDRAVFNEDAGQPTSVDVVLKGSSGRPAIFIECKFDEQEFGGCSVFSDGDCSGQNPIGAEDTCFLHFIGRRYWSLMARHGITKAVQSDRQCLLAAHYQFFREAMFAWENEGTFVLLSDDRSPVFRCRSGGVEKGLLPFLTSLLPEDMRTRVVAVSTQELVAAVEQQARHQDWIFEFKRKYGMG